MVAGAGLRIVMSSLSGAVGACSVKAHYRRVNNSALSLKLSSRV